MEEEWGNSIYNQYNRFENLDGIECKILNELVNDDSKYAENFWKILKYDDLNALSHPNLTKKEKLNLVNNENGESCDKRVFLTPRNDDGQVEQNSSVYIYVEKIHAINNATALVSVTVDTSVYTKVGVIAGDGDKDSSENPQWVNPNESNQQGNVVVSIKSRATVLLKCILALLNGMYLDGIGYLGFTKFEEGSSQGDAGIVDMPHNHRENSHGHRIVFGVKMTGISSSPNRGF